jgi:hypothetical protein
MMVDNLGERSVPARREGRREAAAKHPNRSRCNLGDDGVLIKAGSGIADSLRPLLGISKTILIGSATTQGLNTNCLGSDAGAWQRLNQQPGGHTRTRSAAHDDNASEPRQKTLAGVGHENADADHA